MTLFNWKSASFHLDCNMMSCNECDPAWFPLVERVALEENDIRFSQIPLYTWEFLAKLPSLQEISLRNVTLPNGAAQQLSHIRTFVMEAPLLRVSFINLMSDIRALTNLTTLDLVLEDDYPPTTMLVNALGAHPRLSYLKMPSPHETAFPSMRNLTRIQSLTLTPPCRPLQSTDFFSVLTTLQKLHLPFTQLGVPMPHMSHLTNLQCMGPLRCLTALQSLRELILDGNSLPSEMKSLSALSALETLQLKVHTDAQRVSFTSLQRLHRLNALYLIAEGKPFANTFLSTLPHTLSSLRTLRVTCCKDTKILVLLDLEAQNDPKFEVRALRALTSLEILEITKAPVPIADICDVLTHLTRLRELTLRVSTDLLLRALPYQHLPLLYKVNNAACADVQNARLASSNLPN